MPTLTLTTNVTIPDEKAFVKEFSAFSANTLAKPEGYIMINVRHNPTLTFAGSFDPALILEIVSLGNISPEKNEEYSKAFFAYLEDKLGIKNDRGYISFTDPGNAYLGYKGTTFATIFGKQ